MVVVWWLEWVVVFVGLGDQFGVGVDVVFFDVLYLFVDFMIVMFFSGLVFLFVIVVQFVVIGGVFFDVVYVLWLFVFVVLWGDVFVIFGFGMLLYQVV